MSAEQRVVLITGCSTGIGRATARRLAGHGWTVYATARRLDSIADLEQAGCKTLVLDVCDDASMQEAVGTIEQREGGIGALVNNAGYGQEGAFETTPMDTVRRQFETNVFGLIRLTQLVLPSMRREGWGRIVNMSSMGGKLTLPGGGFYHATKHAVEALSDALRFEVRGFGIDVVVIEPGAIKTQFGDTAIASIVEDQDSPYGAFNAQVATVIRDAYEGPMGKLAAPPDAVAQAVEKALIAERPKTRYVITAAAWTLLGLKRTLTDRGFDAFLRTLYISPGTK